MACRETYLSKWRFAVTLTAMLMLSAVSALAANTATAPVPRTDAKWLARHQAGCDRIKAGHVNLLWIGDSIVQTWQWDGEPVWNKYYAHRDAANLGISGDNTEQVLWRLEHCNLESVSPKLAIVMIGQNNGPSNTAEEIAEGVTAIVTNLRHKRPDMKVLVLGIFFRGEKPNDEQIKLAKSNDIIARLADDRHVFYMNINKIFLNPDGAISKSLMPDFEHPNEQGCRLWAETIEPKVAELLGDTPVK